jgi:cysteine desulfurase
MSEEIPSRPIYMDHHATTPLDPRVLETMLPYFTEIYGNAASTDHTYGLEAKHAVDTARQQIASAIKVQPEEIIFTSGATEANNLAIIGVAEQYKDKGNHIITCVTEHPAVLDTCRYLERKGWQVTYLPVDQQGLIDPEDVRKAITPETVLITIMAANNEIGVLAPLIEIGKIAREHEVLFHTDATQALAYIPIAAESMNIDLLSMSGHKIYGPKGIGALYVRKRYPRVRLAEQIHGGGHERGMRSGTLNVPSIVGLGKALEIAVKEMKEESERVRGLRDQLWQGLQENIEGIELNGHPTKRLPNNLSVAIPGVENRSLLVHLKDYVAISTGSACTTAKVEPSHVVLALDCRKERAYTSLRLSLGRNNSVNDVDTVLQQLTTITKQLRNLTLI